jgi:hypothetical protein
MNNVLQTLGFGSGLLFALPSGGNQPTTPSPVEIGVLQNVKLTFSGDIKELKGQLQFAVDSAVGNRSIKGSFSHAQMTLQAWNNIFFGESAISSGGRGLSYQQAEAIPATPGPYTVTPAVPGSGTWAQDGGVKYAATGVPLQPFASGPTQGQYSVSAGVYTFAAADQGVAVVISYYYTTTTGSTLTINNHTMGFGPIVSLDLTMPYQGFDKNLFLPNVRISKLDLATKQDDYTMTDSDFSVFSAPSGVVGQIYLPN